LNCNCDVAPHLDFCLPAQWREIKQDMAALHIDYPGLDASVVAPSVSSAASGAALFTAVLALLGAVLVVATPSMASDVDVLAAVEYQ
jgi:hypothetical protein